MSMTRTEDHVRERSSLHSNSKEVTAPNSTKGSGANSYLIIGLVIAVIIGFITHDLSNVIECVVGFWLLCIFINDGMKKVGSFLFGSAKSQTKRLYQSYVPQNDISEPVEALSVSSSSLLEPVSSPTDTMRIDKWLSIVNDALDDAPHTFIVGDTGSGKTVLAQAIITSRSGQFIIADPKPKPGKWGGLPFVSVDDEGECTPINTLFLEVLQEIKERLSQMKEGKEDFTPLTVVVDEWPFVKGECPDTAPVLLKRLGNIGRELRIRLLGITQSDRVKTLGIEGEGDARGNFTIIRLGKHAINVQPLTRSMDRPACLEWKGDFLPITTVGALELSRTPIPASRLWITDLIRTKGLLNTNNGIVGHNVQTVTDTTIDLREETDRHTATQAEVELVRWWLDGNPSMSDREIARRLYCFREGLDYATVYPGGKILEGSYDGSGDLWYRAGNARSRL